MLCDTQQRAPACARSRLINHKAAPKPRDCQRVLLFGAAFALGGASRRGCPTSYVRLITEDACASAALIGGMTFGDAAASSYYPAGCFWHTITGSVYFNPHATGGLNYYAQPLCAGAARSCAHMRARRVQVHRQVRRRRHPRSAPRTVRGRPSA
jgi:hypothetical protein